MITTENLKIYIPLVTAAIAVVALSACAKNSETTNTSDAQTTVYNEIINTDSQSSITSEQTGEPVTEKTDQTFVPDTKGPSEITGTGGTTDTSYIPVTSLVTETTAAETTAQITTTTVVTTTKYKPTEEEMRLVNVVEYIPDIIVDLRYASDDNDAGFPIYNYDDAYLRYGTVVKLSKVQAELEQMGLSLKIWDAYRPLDAQLNLAAVLPTAGSEITGSSFTKYNTGSALSLTIVKSDGTVLPVPSDFDDSSALADRKFSDLSSNAKYYGNLLDSLMKKYGFKQYTDVWYRYTDSVDYDVDPSATLTKEGFTEYEYWTVVCNNEIFLRQRPYESAGIIAHIPKNAKVKVITLYERFAYVEYKGKLGYVYSGYLSSGSVRNDISSVTITEKYTYEMMQSELAALALKYPDLLRIDSIGTSQLGKDLTIAILGNEEAENRIFVSAAIHAREHMTALLAVSQIAYMLEHPQTAFDESGITFSQILETTCFIILPMSNPDGIAISQSGVIPEMFAEKYTDYYAPIWKANAIGIDLNANFDADWDLYSSIINFTKPSYMGYKGTSPECAAESKAIADFIRSENFDLVLSYHSEGSIIYWSYGDVTSDTNQLCKEIAQLIALDSGFLLDWQASTSTAGLKDWCISKMQIPSLTIEFGTTSCPMDLREFYSIWERSKNILAISALWVDTID